MRVVVAPQEFKGSLTAREAADCIAGGVREAMPDAYIDTVPMSDGGAGLVDALRSSRGGETVTARVHDPLMRLIDASWALLSDGTAAIETAAASGLVLLRDAERDPMRATTFGTGALIRAALDRRCPEIIVGVGGSATVDAGAGALRALGARLLDAGGNEIGFGGGPLAALDRIDVSGIDRRLRDVRLRVACDVTNTLCGPEGAAAMFGPQKGARPDDIAALDGALHRFADVVRRDCGIDVLTMPGGGAAGGLGAGLAGGAGATLEPGFALVARVVGLDERIARADLVITGEGKLDAQTSHGKTADGVATMARTHGVLVGIVAGIVDDAADASRMFHAVEQSTPPGIVAATAMRDAADLVCAASARLVRTLADQSRRR